MKRPLQVVGEVVLIAIVLVLAALAVMIAVLPFVGTAFIMAMTFLTAVHFHGPAIATLQLIGVVMAIGALLWWKERSGDPPK